MAYPVDIRNSLWFAETEHRTFVIGSGDHVIATVHARPEAREITRLLAAAGALLNAAEIAQEFVENHVAAGKEDDGTLGVIDKAIARATDRDRARVKPLDPHSKV